MKIRVENVPAVLPCRQIRAILGPSFLLSVPAVVIETKWCVMDHSRLPAALSPMVKRCRLLSSIFGSGGGRAEVSLSSDQIGNQTSSPSKKDLEPKQEGNVVAEFLANPHVGWLPYLSYRTGARL
jgi:hypothetical protein